MKLYFIRHGQTDFNKAHRLQGVKFNEPLNTIGEQEMKDVLPSLPTDFEVIFASPLARVQMSAEIIANHFNKPIITREELVERNFGSLAGKTWDEIEDGRALQAIDRALQYDYRPYGGESVEEVESRLQKFLDYTKSSGYKSALAVSSLGVIRLAHKLLLNQEITETHNASIHLFEV